MWQRILGEEKSPENLDDSPAGVAFSREINTRNDIRRLLIANFESIHIWRFPPPVFNIQAKEIRFGDLCAEFSDQVGLSNATGKRVIFVLLLGHATAKLA